MSATVRPRRASTRQGRGGSAGPGSRNGAGSGARRGRRTLVIGGTLLVAALGVFLLLNSDRFQRTLEEFTLPLRHEDIIRQQAAEKGVPPDLIAAVIYSESRFRDQTSHAGARGLMQITPSTAKLIEKLSGGRHAAPDAVVAVHAPCGAQGASRSRRQLGNSSAVVTAPPSCPPVAPP